MSRRGRVPFAHAALVATALFSCGKATDQRKMITFSGSEVGAEGEVLRLQLGRFETLHSGLKVELLPTPDAADQRHQLYAQWLNAHAGEPDVLQLDVIWVAEFAAAGWILPLERFNPETSEFFPNVLEADQFEDKTLALPWFVDVGMLYYRTDLVPRPPATFEELMRLAAQAKQRKQIKYGFVFQGARYEGLTATYLEILGGFGGRIHDPSGRVAVDSEAGIRALDFLNECLHTGISPPAVLNWQEEQARFAFQSGEAAFMRNWPYAYRLLQDPASSKVAGRFAVAAMPAEGGRSTSALGGAQLAINAYSEHSAEAFALIEFLTQPEQMVERARLAGQLPARRALYYGASASALPIPAAEAVQIIEHAAPRPVSPIYTELSEMLQIGLHRALTGQVKPRVALAEAARQMRELEEHEGLGPGPRPPERKGTWLLLIASALVVAFAIRALLRARKSRNRARGPREARLAWLLVLPTLGLISLMVIFPLIWTGWESLHLDDLRMPWRGTPFVGLANWYELAESARFREAVAHTALFAATSVALEMLVGLSLALALNRGFRGRAGMRAAVLLPWAIPTVVAAQIWRFLFDSQAGVANLVLSRLGLVSPSFVWFVDARAAWVPVILADVWKNTPFVALLLLAGLQNIPQELYEAARVDGAGVVRQLRFITLPLLKPALLIAFLFRTLDALRVFDLVYVLTGGGPGTATEPVAVTTFDALLQDLRFGLGSAMSVAIFLLALALALLAIRAMGPELTRSEE